MDSSFKLGEVETAEPAAWGFDCIEDRDMRMHLHIARHKSIRTGEDVQLGYRLA